MSQHCNICKHIISKYQAVNCVHFFTEKKITLKFLPTFLHSILWGTALILNSSEKTCFVMLTITTILLNFICIKYWGFFYLIYVGFHPESSSLPERWPMWNPRNEIFKGTSLSFFPFPVTDTSILVGLYPRRKQWSRHANLKGLCKSHVRQRLSLKLCLL